MSTSFLLLGLFPARVGKFSLSPLTLLMRLLGMLGLDTVDIAGSIEGEDMLGRVLMAQGASIVDAGVPAVQDGIMVDCGRPEGYSDDRLVEIEEVARYAAERNLEVSWS